MENYGSMSSTPHSRELWKHVQSRDLVSMEACRVASPAGARQLLELCWELPDKGRDTGETRMIQAAGSSSRYAASRQ